MLTSIPSTPSANFASQDLNSSKKGENSFASHSIHTMKPPKNSTKNEDSKPSIQPSFTNITHCLFDMDGLVLDTEGIYTQVTEEILRPYGKTFEFSLKAKMMGRNALSAAQILVDETKIPLSPEEYVQLRDKMHVKYFPHCKVMPGAEKLIRHLKACKIPIALATSSKTDSFELKIQNHKPLFSLFDVVVRGDDPDLKKSKPAPDIFLLAAHRLSANLAPSPQQCLVFEDAPSGVAAGIAAGMNVVMIPDCRIDPLLTKNAHCVLENFHQFKPELWGLPPFPDDPPKPSP